MALPSLDDYFPDWKEREALAEAMIPIIGRLYRRNVVSYCYGRALYNQSVMQIMKTHRYVRQTEPGNELSEFESYPILEALSQLDLGPSHIDVGKLAFKYMQESASSSITPVEFCERECAEVIGRHIPPLKKPQ
ncbi:MAG: glyceraldehyde-3-phosphate dehydrogenase, partial [Pseudomonadales bacterium]